MTCRFMALLATAAIFASGRAEEVRLVGHLRQASVELVGVTHYRPSERSRWWRPDGTVTRIGPYLHEDGKHGGLRIRRGRRGVTFLLRFQKPRTAEHPRSPEESYRQEPDESGLGRYPLADQSDHKQGRHDQSSEDTLYPAFMFKPWGMSPEVDDVAVAGTGLTSRRMNVFSPSRWDGTVVDTDDNWIPRYHMFSAVVAKPAKTAVLRVGLSKDDWETVAAWKPEEAGTTDFSQLEHHWTVVFENAEVGTTPERTNVTLKTTVSGWEAYGKLTPRLVAVTTDNEEHVTRHGAGSWDSGRTIQFDLPLDSIEELRFQVSPYDWVEFRGVSLQPGQKTVVEVNAL